MNVVQRYSMTLPSGMQVEVVIEGLKTLLGANELYKKNEANHCTYEQCLVMACLVSANGEPVANIPPDGIFLAKDLNALSVVLQQMIMPNQQELAAMVSTIKAIPDTVVTPDAPIPTA